VVPDVDPFEHSTKRLHALLSSLEKIYVLLVLVLEARFVGLERLWGDGKL
jgi:hypothetical protein